MSGAAEGRRVRVVFADDEPLNRSTLRALLGEDPAVEVVAECANGAEALLATRSLAPDLLFLDVQMPGLTGIDVVEELADEERPIVVFVTAYDHYALRAFDLHAVDYLLKPFDDDRFRLALERAKKRWSEGRALEEGRNLGAMIAGLEGHVALGSASSTVERAATGAPLTRIAIHSEGRSTYVEVAELVWVEAADQYVKLHTKAHEHLMRGSMGQLEADLGGGDFFRVHRSAIVRLSAVRALESQGAGGRVRLVDGTWIPVSRTKIAALRKLLG